jgi:2-dehydro-3-deoxyphosphooctonate aldolase (KDO 8-P synthase)
MELKSTQKPILIAGPCSLEGRVQAHEIADKCSQLANKYGFDYYFKASFDKANRTSVNSKRGIGIDKAIKIFKELKELQGCKITTDIHEPWQADKLADVVDIIQIPAYLCRQTDLLVAAGNTWKTVNIKKGQFIDGSNMIHAINKVKSTDNNQVMLTERGSMFGMGDLVVDPRQIVDMKELGVPVIMDCTHSTQRPNSGNTTAGQPKYTLPIAKVAKALDVDGYFFEVHPNPSAAWSDGSNMVQLDKFEDILKQLV